MIGQKDVLEDAEILPHLLHGWCMTHDAWFWFLLLVTLIVSPLASLRRGAFWA